VFPLHVQGEHLAVAMADPRERLAIKEMEAASGRTVEPWIAAEHRLAVALERHYRIRPVGARAISVSAPTDPASAVAVEAETAQAAGDVLDLELGLDGHPLHAELDPFGPVLEFHDVGLELSDTAPTPPAPPAAAPAPVTLALEMDVLEEALLSAADRDGLAVALLDFCTSRMRRAALFAVSRDAIRGVAGRGPGLEPERVRAVTLPRGGASILDTALASKDFYFGVVPKLPANHDLYSVLGGTLPSAALVLPVLVKGRVAALLYLDEGERPLTRPDIPLMRRVAAKAGLALELLLLRQKLREI
jgi:hypothetical protein